MNSNQQRDAKQEALDFLDSLEGDASDVNAVSTLNSVPSSFKAFNPSNPSSSTVPTKPKFSSLAINNTQRPPSPSKTLPSSFPTGTSPYRPPVAGFTPTGFTPTGFTPTGFSANSVSVSPPSTFKNNRDVNNPVNQNNGQPPHLHSSQSLSNSNPLNPPPLSKPAITGSPGTSSKRVHAFIPGMKPDTTKTIPVPEFAPSTAPVSFPVGEVLDQTQYNPSLSDNIISQPHENQQASSNNQVQDLEDSMWSWGTSLWSTAQKGLANAKTVAGTAAQTLQQSETVKGLVKNYKPELEKLGNVIAPPLSFGGYEEKLNVKFPQGLTVWLCLSLPPSMVGERVLRMSKQSMREWWNGHLVPVYPGATVNFVDDTLASYCTSVHQAVIKSEETMEKLQKLADGHVGETKHVLFTIQPFKTTLQSTILETIEQTQFYCCMVCDAPNAQAANGTDLPPTSTLIYASCVSQSVSSAAEVDEDWKSEMTSRVLETAVSDMIEEFATKILKIS